MPMTIKKALGAQMPKVDVPSNQSLRALSRVLTVAWTVNDGPDSVSDRADPI